VTQRLFREELAVISVALALWFARPDAHMSATRRPASRPTPAAKVGFQQLAIHNEANDALPVGLWYPTTTPPREQPLALFTQVVARNGVIGAAHLPLVVISHGTCGSLASHYDTAHALAAAGSVVAALTHPGDNAQDQRLAGSRRYS
jgi:predicted dienelactone hydrolase